MTSNSKKENGGKDRLERSLSPGVKSRAVVKYTAVPGPVGFARLQCNTDLNLPPADWLSGASVSYGLQRMLRDGATCSSFRMAHMFPDSVGEVDVVSGAECIKTLLKLPYQPNSTVSMMVHRVENTLLLDEFHMYEYLMKSEWAWLRGFLRDDILGGMSEQDGARALRLPERAGAAPLLTSQFLCHSIATQPPPPPPPPPAPVQRTHLEHAPPLAGPSLPEPEARAEGSSAHEPHEPHEYSRTVLWTFEDIQMLIGSDLPIFGGAERPCVSLRLRDATEPINVLTGIDYWLDNLMCNVPEVLMCYHIDGIVQKYEPMKTEELPHLEGSRFSPRVIRNVAQNILSFLKANATKAGHTYWLFKGARDDVVKLYDLTSLCGGLGASEGTDNPFTTPVAMLLYRVARNLLQARARRRRRTAHARTLLEHTVTLLAPDSHPQILASAHYMLSDVYVPATTDPVAPHFKEESSDSDLEDDDFESEVDPASEQCKETNTDDNDQESNDQTAGERVSDEQSAGEHVSAKQSAGERISDEQCTGERVPVQNRSGERVSVEQRVGEQDQGTGQIEANDVLEQESTQLALKMRGLALQDIGKSIRPSSPEKSKSKSSAGLGTDAPARCGKALQHALLGLRALHAVTLDKCKEEEKERLRQQRLREEQNPRMANPCEPIELQYEPLDRRRAGGGRRRRRERAERCGNSLIESGAGKVDRNAILARKERAAPTWREPDRDDKLAWKLHLKTLLYEKICLAYATLAEFSYAREQYGFALRYIRLASACQRLLSGMLITSRVVDESCLLGRAGDSYFQLSKHWESFERFRVQFETEHDTDRRLRREIENDLSEETGNVRTDDDVALEIKLPESATDAMQLSCDKYKLALSVSDAAKRDELMRRLASVGNELGVRYMHLSQDAYVKYYQEIEESKEVTIDNKNLQEHHDLAKKSLVCLDEATELFRRVNDMPNLALLYCNKGRYMRFRAHCQLGGFSVEQRRMYEEAESLYTLALRALGGRESSGASAVWDLVCWELSSAAYTRATLQQEHAVDAAAAPEVIDALKNALKHCHVGPGRRQYLYQFRAAMIYHRLGSLYHKQHRESCEEGARRRTLLQLARTNYEQASELFTQLEDGGMALTVTLEHVAALEGQAANSPNVRLKSLQSALQLLRRSAAVLALVARRDAESASAPSESAPAPLEPAAEGGALDDGALVALLASRLQFVLKSLTQHCRARAGRDHDRMAAAYKEMYVASLAVGGATAGEGGVAGEAARVRDALARIDDIAAAAGL